MLVSHSAKIQLGSDGKKSAKGKYERWPGVGYCLIKSSAERLWEGPASNNNASRHCANSTVYTVYVKQIVLSKLRLSN